MALLTVFRYRGTVLMTVSVANRKRRLVRSCGEKRKASMTVVANPVPSSSRCALGAGKTEKRDSEGEAHTYTLTYRGRGLGKEKTHVHAYTNKKNGTTYTHIHLQLHI